MSALNEKWVTDASCAIKLLDVFVTPVRSSDGTVAYVFTYENAKAIAALPEILRTATEALKLVDKVSAYLNPKQKLVVDELRVAVGRAGA